MKTHSGVENMLLWLCEKKPWREGGLAFLGREFYEIPRDVALTVTREDAEALLGARMERGYGIAGLSIRRIGEPFGVRGFIERTCGDGSTRFEYVELLRDECERNLDEPFLYMLKESLAAEGGEGE